MEDEGRKQLEAELGTYVQQLREIDEIAQIILKGHLAVERQLEHIIRHILLHPNYVLEGHFGFERKVQIVRSYSLNAHDHRDWAFLGILNELRNEIAHREPGETRKQKIDKARKAFLERVFPEARKKFENSTDETIALAICMTCGGFLDHIQEDIESLRGAIDDMLERAWSEPKE